MNAGTLVAPLGADPLPAHDMPTVTMVFALVENAKVLSSKAMKQAETLLLACASSCLDQVMSMHLHRSDKRICNALQMALKWHRYFCIPM